MQICGLMTVADSKLIAAGLKDSIAYLGKF